MKKNQIRRPSDSALVKLYESGKKEIVIISWKTIDKPTCECRNLILQELFRVNNNKEKKELHRYIECPEVKKNKLLKKYNIYCKSCNQLLGYFHSIKPSLDGEYYNLHHVAKYDKKSWYGCLGINVNPYNLKVNFECCCGNKKVKSVSLNTKRYTNYYIEESK